MTNQSLGKPTVKQPTRVCKYTARVASLTSPLPSLGFLYCLLQAVHRIFFFLHALKFHLLQHLSSLPILHAPLSQNFATVIFLRFCLVF